MKYLGTLRFYRRCLKSMMTVFENDVENFHWVWLETRKRILENKDLQGETLILDKICEGEEIR